MFSVISLKVGVYPAASSTFITPADSKTLRALPPLVASLGIAIESSFFNSSNDFILLEYTPSGAIIDSPTTVKSKFLSLISWFKYA